MGTLFGNSLFDCDAGAHAHGNGDGLLALGLQGFGKWLANPSIGGRNREWASPISESREIRSRANP